MPRADRDVRGLMIRTGPRASIPPANAGLMTETVLRERARAYPDRTASSRVTAAIVPDPASPDRAGRAPAEDVPAVPAAPDSAAAECRATA